MIKETIVKLEGTELKWAQAIRKDGWYVPEQRTVKISDEPIPIWIMGSVCEDFLIPPIGESYLIDKETRQLVVPQDYMIDPACELGEISYEKTFELTADSIYAADFDDGTALNSYWFTGFLSEEDAKEAKIKAKKKHPEYNYIILRAQIPANNYFFALESWNEDPEVKEVAFRLVEPLNNKTNED